MDTIEKCQVISAEDKALLREMKAIVQKELPTAEVLLHGSVARGTKDPESDYDILVLTDGALAAELRRGIERQILELELANDVVLSTIYHSKSEWRLRLALPFYNEVEKHGVAL